MAGQAANALPSFSHVQGLTELKRRLLFVLGALIVFRIGSFIPLPGIDTSVLAKLFEQQRGTILEMFNVFSGGALRRASIFALGIVPYISASIIVQLLTIVHPKLIELKKEGEAGRRILGQYTRYGTLGLSLFQALGIAIGLPNMLPGLVDAPSFSFYFTAVVSLVTGTMFLMWLGEQMTERGVGNGTSLLIFAGIVAGLPPAVLQTLEQARQGSLSPWLLLFILTLMGGVIYLVVFVERAQRKLLVHYANQFQGRRAQPLLARSAQSSHLPLKVNMAGVMPAIFASSIILFPSTIVQWFGHGTRFKWLTSISATLQPGQPLYMLTYGIAIVFFCFFYTALVFNPKETADNLKKANAFLPGVRPGLHTAQYIDTIMTRLSLIGAVYIASICLLPEFLMVAWKIRFYFGGTSLLIVVVVVMEFLAQVQTYFMSQQYDSILKKAHLKSIR